MLLARSAVFTVLLVVPLHTLLMFNLVPGITGLPQSLVSAWKEGLLVVAAVAMSYTALSERAMRKPDLLDCCAAAVLMVALTGILTAESVSVAAAASRMLLVPVFMFYCSRGIHLEDTDLVRWGRIFFAVGACVAAWGAFQALVLGPDFFYPLEYVSYDGTLSASFYISGFDVQRAVGTLSSPLVFGSYCQLVLAIGFGLYGSASSVLEKRGILCGMAVVSGGLFLSFTRSAWMATALSLALYLAMARRFRLLLKLLFLVPAVTAVVLFVVYLHDPIYIEALISHVVGTVTLTDPSALGHLESLRSGWGLLVSSPLGFGLGSSGPRALVHGETDLLVENSYLLVGLDTGVLGFAIFVGFVLSVARSFRRSVLLPASLPRRVLRRAMLSAFVAHLSVTWNLLPEVADTELSFFMFGIAGLLCEASGHLPAGRGNAGVVT